MSIDLRRHLPLLLPLLATLYVLAGAIAGGPLDEEEYRNTILSTVIQARDLLTGAYPFWTSTLGFGVPLPLHPTLVFHPLLPLFGVLAPETAVRLVTAGHVALGVIGCWWLARALGIGPWLAGLAAATWVLATPALNYTLTDFWISHLIGWSLFPLLVLCALRVLEAPAGTQAWGAAVAFGGLAGLMVANGHVSQTAMLCAALAVMCLAQPIRTARAAPALLLAVVIGAAIGAPTITQIALELERFPELPRLTVQVDMGWHAARDLFLRPFLSTDPAQMLDAVAARGARLPFFGGPMLLAALAASAGLARVGRGRLGFVAAFLVSGAVMFHGGLEEVKALSGTFVFRDPLVLFGTMLGTLALQAWSARRPRLVASIAAVQVLVLAVAAWPFVLNASRDGARVTNRFLEQTTATRTLRDWTTRLPGRWYLAPVLDELVRRGTLDVDGLARESWVYRGLPVVNGTFKGVSLDTIYPSGTVPIGRIWGERATAAAGQTLSVLGIGAVLAMADEPVAASLQEVARIDTIAGPARLLRNPDAWPGAAFVDRDATGRQPPSLPDCYGGGALCLDLTAVAEAPHDTGVRIERGQGTLRVQFAPAATARRLLIAEMYRPEWHATAGSTPVPVVPVWDSLIGVDVPPDVTDVTVQFEPAMRAGLTWLALGTALACAMGLAVAAWRRRGV